MSRALKAETVTFRMDSRLKTAFAEIGVVNAQESGPVTGPIVNPVHQAQVRAVPEIDELAGEQEYPAAALRAGGDGRGGHARVGLARG